MQALFLLLGKLRRATETNLDELGEMIVSTDGTSQREFQDRWFAVNLERRRLDQVQSLLFAAWSEYRRLDVDLMRGDHSHGGRADDPLRP